ncbi:glutathione S-transferase family protein [Polycladidibacter hongkongensis]|uniref:glutathione S-transferase family protein n=1 Tax=Polycladidibacter hongkongensis TaxID=1647556 RepID=UPI00082B14BA|nr:glutathione S-transferase N-terminal domain-containing protein [Pseudovibrio hongkongensis]
MVLKLYSAEGSNCSERVEWVLVYKGLKWERIEVTAEDLAGPYQQNINPFGFVPMLDHDGFRLAESIAIIEYLEELHPNPAVLGNTITERARIREICSFVSTTIHSPQNRSVLTFFRPELETQDKKRLRAAWIAKTLGTLEPMLWQHSGFCQGSNFSLADIFVATIYKKLVQHGGDPLPAYEEHREFLFQQNMTEASRN